MAMNAATMSSDMQGMMTGVTPSNTYCKLDEFTTAACTAIIDYLSTNWKTSSAWYHISHGHTVQSTLVGVDLGTAIKEEVAATGFFTSGGSYQIYEAFCDAIGKGIVDYLLSYASYTASAGAPHSHTPLTLVGSTIISNIKGYLGAGQGFNRAHQYCALDGVVDGIGGGFASHVNANVLMTIVYTGGVNHYHTHS